MLYMSSMKCILSDFYPLRISTMFLCRQGRIICLGHIICVCHIFCVYHVCVICLVCRIQSSGRVCCRFSGFNACLLPYKSHD